MPASSVRPRRTGAASSVRALNRRSVVLALAAATVVVEICSYGGVVPTIPIGNLAISASIVPGLLLALACGERLLGRSRARRAAVAYWLAAVGALTALSVAFSRFHRPLAVPGLVLAAFDEELVYRLAVPAVVALVLRKAAVDDRRARIAGLVIAGLWFVLLPGHREQMTSPARAVPFLAFAALSAILVYRSGSILPIAVAHAMSNLLTILMWDDAVPSGVRSALLGCVMALLVLAYGRPRHIAHGDDGRLIDVRTGQEVEVVDLRDDDHPSAILTDGQVVPLAGTVGDESRARPVDAGSPSVVARRAVDR